MKRNKLFIYLLFVLPALLFASCLKDQEDFFDEPSSTRLNNYLSNAHQVLKSSENGWVFEVFPGKTQSYGGFVYTVKFDSLTCTVSTELADDNSATKTSYYKMTTEAGAALIFDTYNDYIHYLSEGTSSRYQAYGGDVEFVLDSVGTDVIKVHGARSGSTSYFRRLTTTSKAYLDSVSATRESFIYTTYYGEVGGKVAGVTLNLNSNQFTITSDTTEVNSTAQTTAFVFTDKGIRLYEALTVNGMTLFDLTFDRTAGTLTGTDGNGSTYTLTGVLPKGYRKFDAFAGTYTLRYDSASSSKTVVLTADAANNCYYMRGLFVNSPSTAIRLDYSKTNGCLYMNSQQVATENGNEVWLCAWALSYGYSFDNDAGMRTVWNGNETNPVYTWADNGLSDLTVNSFLIWTYRVGPYSGTTYAVDGGYRIRYMSSLTKQ